MLGNRSLFGKAYILLLFVIAISSCSEPLSGTTVSRASPYSSAQGLGQLENGAGLELTEVVTFYRKPGSGPVVAIHNIPATDTILFVTIGDGYLRRWNLTTKEIVSEHNLGIVSSVGVGFDETGSLVIGATMQKNQTLGETNFKDDYIKGIAVWDTTDGELMYCIEPPCEGYPTIEENPVITTIGACLDPKGLGALSYIQSVIRFVSFSDQSTDMRSTIDPDAVLLPTIGRIAFDTTGERYAVAFREGKVELASVESKSFSAITSVSARGNNDFDDPRFIPALTFSPDNKKLAVVWGDQLIVWSLKRFHRNPIISEEIPGANFLAFNRTGDLLFLGTDSNILVVDITYKTTHTIFDTPGITSLSVSMDNRLLIWGDKEGTVHIWAQTRN